MAIKIFSRMVLLVGGIVVVGACRSGEVGCGRKVSADDDVRLMIAGSITCMQAALRAKHREYQMLG